MNITKVSHVSSHRQHTLTNITAEEINNVLGFSSNVDDDPDKVKDSWGFDVDGKECAIWDYNGSHRDGEYSAFGDFDTLVKLFPNNI